MATVPEIIARIKQINSEIAQAQSIIARQDRILSSPSISAGQRQVSERLKREAQSLFSNLQTSLALLEEELVQEQQRQTTSAVVRGRDSAGSNLIATQPESVGGARPLAPQQQQNLERLGPAGPGDDDSSAASAAVTAQQQSGDVIAATNAGRTARQSVRSTDPAVESSKQGSPVSDLDRVPPSNNILHNYSNYTYLLSWHLMTIEDYNRLVTDANSRYIPKNVLVSSAGKYNSEFARNPAWQEDFYFESLEMQTVVGLNARSRGTNAIDISFKLIEPYGASLLERLLKAADSRETSVSGSETETPVTASNYTQLPYMLQIDFAGYSDAGVPTTIPGVTKYIPINILTIEFTVSNRGSEYTIRAVPFNHQAFKSSQASIPANFEIQPTTVGSFFAGSGEVTDDAFGVRAASVNRRDAAVKAFSDIQRTFSEELGGDFSSVKDLWNKEYQEVIDAERAVSTYAVDGLASALSDYYLFEQIRATGASITVAPEYKFIIPKEIADATIDKVERPDPGRTPTGSSTATGQTSPDQDYRASQKTQKNQPAPGIPLDPNTKRYTINAGTSIIEVINTVIRNSSYILKQIDATNAGPVQNERDAAALVNNNTTPLNWFKIVPRVEIKGYDTKLNTYALRMTYEVITYPVYGRTIPRVSQAPVPEESISKIYNYIYTGQNQDILDINIEFNTQYFMAITSSPDKFFSITSDTPAVSQISPTQQLETDPHFPVRTQTVSSNQQESYARANDPKAIAATDVAENLMNSSADMMSIKLKIIGDPAWIKQDDIFNTTERQQLLAQEATNSIPTDAAEVYVRLNFRVPTDIDDVKGTYNFDKMNYGVFSGIYRVLTVTSRFERGQFTQDLDLVRILKQKPANNPSQPGDNDQRTGQGLGQSVVLQGLATRSQNPAPDTTMPSQFMLAPLRSVLPLATLDFPTITLPSGISARGIDDQ